MRDQRWELDEPVYRVYFWRPDGSACRQYELREVADVTEVLEWARTFPETEAGLAGWVPEIWVTHQSRVDGLGLIRLMGRRPNQADSSATIRF